jgi:periplasmic protein TonB
MPVSAVSLRMAKSAALAVVTTVALFLTMKVLVTGQDLQVDDAANAVGVDFLRIERDEELNAKERALKRPTQEQDEPPPPPKLRQTSRPNFDKAAMNVDLSDFDLAAMNLNAPVDGDALAILRVQPRYPSRAAARGIEGWVLLEFDVDGLGQAVNPVVIEGEPKGVFDRAAINAVKKWKYRPMIENGRPVMRTGVRQQFRFVISK